jgi:hypothetical protein
MQLRVNAYCAMYKDYTIVHTVRRIGSKVKEYMAVAFIVWTMPDRRRRVMHCLTLQQTFAAEEEAHNAAFNEARKWVDNHLLFEL